MGNKSTAGMHTRFQPLTLKSLQKFSSFSRRPRLISHFECDENLKKKQFRRMSFCFTRRCAEFDKIPITLQIDVFDKPRSPPEDQTAASSPNTHRASDSDDAQGSMGSSSDARKGASSGIETHTCVHASELDSSALWSPETI